MPEPEYMSLEEFRELEERDRRAAEFARQERRDRAVERASRAPKLLPGHFTSAVVGVSFAPGYPDNLHALDHAMKSRVLLDLGDPEPLPAILVRNPENPYDTNAIAVHCPSLGDNAMIGHLPRALAVRLAPEMDAGHLYAGAIHYVKVHDDHPDRPGIEITIARIPDEDWRLPGGD